MALVMFRARILGFSFVFVAISSSFFTRVVSLACWRLHGLFNA